jgi:hypothetical protein
MWKDLEELAENVKEQTVLDISVKYCLTYFNCKRFYLIA